MKKASSAFTLVELIVVVAIMGMGLSLFLGINYRQREAFRWRTNLRELHVFLKVARSYAVLERRRNECLYSIEQRSFSENLRGKQVGLAPGVELAFSDEQQVLVDALENEIEVEEVDSDEAKPKVVMVTFYADGGASGGPLEIRSGRRGAFLEVDPLTGTVKVEERVEDDAER